MSQLVCYDRCNYLLLQRGRQIANQKSGLSESDETPVLHGSCQEVRDGHQVCGKKDVKTFN